jgi:hypothetical protein
VWGKSVLIVCPDQEKLLLKACLDAGAKCVYVAESNLEAFARTEPLLLQNEPGRVVSFLLGGEGPALEDPIDICITDYLGNIGGAKGLELCLQKLRPMLPAFVPGVKVGTGDRILGNACVDQVKSIRCEWTILLKAASCFATEA